MSDRIGKYIYVKSPWQFETRQINIRATGKGQILVAIKACGVCGTDLHTADRTAGDWQSFGHEMSGVVLEIGDGVKDFAVGDRVALDSSAPCGKCEYCRPTPYGRGRPDLCASPVSYWNSTAMGYGEYIIAPVEVAVKIPDSMSYETASLAEPTGVALDILTTAEVGIGDHVLVMGPGPIGLIAACIAKHMGADRVIVSGRSRAKARLAAAMELGADAIIESDKTSVADFDYGTRRPNKILVTSPPETIPDAIAAADKGAVIAYIGMAFGIGDHVEFEGDDFHMRKLSLKGSFASPSIFLANAVRYLDILPQIGNVLVGPVFELKDIEKAFGMFREDHGKTVLKPVMVNK